MDEILFERLVVAIEHLAASQMDIAAQMPALIEATGRRGSWGGKNKKDGKDWGLFRVRPDLTNIPDNDVFHLPVTMYRYDTKYKRLEFFSPFDVKGIYSPSGVKAATIDPLKKNFTDIFKDWKFNDSGEKIAFAIRIIKMRVGTMEGKRIASIAGVGAPADGITGPEQLTYVVSEEEITTRKDEENIPY